MLSQTQFFLCALVGSVLLVGAGCTLNQPPKVNPLTPQEQELNTPIITDREQKPVSMVHTTNTSTRPVVQEPELNTPYIEDQEEQRQLKDLLDNSYFFVVENKNNDFGKNSEYGILAVRVDCSTFSSVQLSQNNDVTALRKLINKPILLQNFEAYHGEFTVKDIQEDTIHAREIEQLKKTCTEPFVKYLQ